MASKDDALYGIKRQKNLSGGKAISSGSTLAFTSQLSSLINNSSTSVAKSVRGKGKKNDIFSGHNCNIAKRARRDLAPDNASVFEQKHTTKGETLDASTWARSKRKMEEKARLYAAMKRGDVEDKDERYLVDFDRMWAEKREEGKDYQDSSDEDSDDGSDAEEVEYVDEFGRTRKGSKREADRAKYASAAKRASDENEHASGRPSAPSNVIYGDTIQHQAFELDAPRAAQMEDLARKRDRSLTPPAEEHFDGRREVRTKGTAFFQFSDDATERARQMADLQRERTETEARRAEREGKLEARKREIEARRQELRRKSAKRKAEDFLEALGRGENGVEEAVEGKPDGEEHDEEERRLDEDERRRNLHAHGSSATEVTERIEAAIRQERDET